MANGRFSDVSPKKGHLDGDCEEAKKPSGRTLPKSNPSDKDFAQKKHLDVKGPGETPKAP